MKDDGYGYFAVSDNFLGSFIPQPRMMEIERISLLDKKSVARDIADLGFYVMDISWYQEQTRSCCPKKFCSLCGGDPHPFAECDSDLPGMMYKGPGAVRTMTLRWRGGEEVYGRVEVGEGGRIGEERRGESKRLDPPGAMYKFKLTLDEEDREERDICENDLWRRAEREAEINLMLEEEGRAQLEVWELDDERERYEEEVEEDIRALDAWEERERRMC